MQNNRGYEAIPEEESHFSTNMTKNMALNILGIDDATASMEKIDKQLFTKFLDATSLGTLMPNNPLAEVKALITARTLLFNTMHYKPKSPVITLIRNQHKQSQRAAEQYQTTCDAYFIKLSELFAKIETANRAYLNITNLVGKDPVETYKQYKKAINKLYGEFKKSPQILSDEIIRDQIRALIAENVFQDINNRGGPQQAVTNEVNRLTKQQTHVTNNITQLNRGLRELDKKIIGINAKFAKQLLDTQSPQEIAQLRENYSKAISNNIIKPLSIAAGKDREFTAIIKTLFNELIMDLKKIGDLHLQHQAFIKETESSNDPRIRSFMTEYDNYSNQLDSVLQTYPRFQTHFELLSEKLYALGTQYLLAIQNSDADLHKLTTQLHQDLKTLIEEVNTPFSDADSDWSDAWKILNPAIANLFFDIHVVADPIKEFENQYNCYLKNITDIAQKYTIPEHKTVFTELGGTLQKIGRDYFAAIKKVDANINTLSQNYQELFNNALNRTASKMEAAGIEQAEIWPTLHPILKFLATITFVVKYLIKTADAKTSERNRVFKAEKETFKVDLQQWLKGIPKLNENSLAEQRLRRHGQASPE